jgi:SAM-dependent methyltransferase
MQKKPDYGIDSPGIIAGLALLGGAALFISALLFTLYLSHPGLIPVAIIGAIVGGYFLFGASGMIWYSRVGKLGLREELLNQIPWAGHEKVLDLGCGRGLLAVGAAKRLSTGKAIGIDIWLRRALSGNGPEQVLENANLEGVAGRVEAAKGDVRQLPFDENTFDVIVSNFVFHELPTREQRERMVQEMVRVLKPRGQLAVVDFIFTAQLLKTLREHGMVEVKRSRIGSLFGWIIAAILNFGLVRTYVVTGSKAA